MTLDRILDTARSSVSVRRVFGEPVERDGVTLVPAAVVLGGGGGGGGTGPGGTGEGGGFGVVARPIGAFVLARGTVTWRPAVDLTLLAAVLGLVTAAHLISRPRLVRARAAAAATRAATRS